MAAVKGKKKGLGDKVASGSGGSSEIHAPDEKRFEHAIGSIDEQIKKIESQLKPIEKKSEQDVTTELSQVNTQLLELESKRSDIVREEKRLTSELRELGESVFRRKNEASKLVAGLRHKRMEQYDESIGKLQRQIKANQFTQQEERKALSEIEGLIKAKDQLKEYNEVKEKVKEMRDKQESMRNERDLLYRRLSEIRQGMTRLRDSQGELKAQLSGHRERQREEKEKKDALLREIKELYQQRQQLRDAFRQQQMHYMRASREQRVCERALVEEQARRREEERKSNREARMRKFASQSESLKEQHIDEEKMRCRNLATYVKRLLMSNSFETTQEPLAAAADLVSGGATAASSVSPSPASTSSSSGHASPLNLPPQRENFPPGEFLRRKRDDAVLVGGSGGGGGGGGGGKRKSRREKKKGTTASKRLNLNVEIVMQFESLNLHTPSTYADLPFTLSELQEKLANYEQRAESEAGDSGVGVESGLDEHSNLNSQEDSGIAAST